MGRKQLKTAENLCLGFGCREGKEFCKGLRLSPSPLYQPPASQLVLNDLKTAVAELARRLKVGKGTKMQAVKQHYTEYCPVVFGFDFIVADHHAEIFHCLFVRESIADFFVLLRGKVRFETFAKFPKIP